MEEIYRTTGYSYCGRCLKKLNCTQSVQFFVTKHCKQYLDEHDNPDSVYCIFVYKIYAIHIYN